MLVAQRNNLIERVNKLQQDNTTYTKIITAKEQQIAAMEVQDSIGAKMYQSLLADAGTWSKIRESNMRQIQLLEKQLKKQKRKTTWTAIGGAVLSSGLIYLYLTK